MLRLLKVAMSQAVRSPAQIGQIQNVSRAKYFEIRTTMALKPLVLKFFN
jgi:hypothetical protein